MSHATPSIPTPQSLMIFPFLFHPDSSADAADAMHFRSINIDLNPFRLLKKNQRLNDEKNNKKKTSEVKTRRAKYARATWSPLVGFARHIYALAIARGADQAPGCNMDLDQRLQSLPYTPPGPPSPVPQQLGICKQSLHSLSCCSRSDLGMKKTEKKKE